MKITKVSITGMHKVDHKTYDINEDVTYFVGPNGAGKSTILEAIQLAILGYIPGYLKTKEAIMNHASGKLMEVKVEFGNDASFTRSWIKSGSTVKTDVEIHGFASEEAMLKGVTLPILDFNEFNSMTANKLKEWFIGFLPNSNNNFDLNAGLRNAVKDRALPVDELLADIDQWRKNSSKQGVELIKDLNDYLKEQQSYVKGQIAKLQGTIQSLIKYDDAPVQDDAEIRAAIDVLQQEKTATMQTQANQAARQNLITTLESLQSELQADTFEDDPRVTPLKKTIAETRDTISRIQTEFSKLTNEQNSIKERLRQVPSADAVCPYTKERCETAANLASAYADQYKQIKAELEANQEAITNLNPNQIDKLKLNIDLAQGELNEIQNQYDRVKALKIQVSEYESEVDWVYRPIPQIDAEIAQLNEGLIKIEANKRYEELADTVTCDKFKLENTLEVLKTWIALTGANGLQTSLMDEPFLELADEMSGYLTTLFGKPTKAHFNLQAKANSFSFGLNRDDQYIQFDYLSSGERCLFTLALMMCILDKSDSHFRTILIDDLLDHLDDVNAESLFTSIKQISDIQFILAGVKECNDPTVCQAV